LVEVAHIEATSKLASIVETAMYFATEPNADGRFLAEQGTRDDFGHAQLGGAAPVVANLIKDALGHKYHWAVADYLQRAARHLSSKSDVEQAYALGEAAVNLAMEGKNSVMPAVIRTSNNPYVFMPQCVFN
jgi:6-phosphofructokinase 1